jgi:hypothetical protein
LLIKKIIENNWAADIIRITKEIVKFFHAHHIEGACLARLQQEKIGKIIRLQLPVKTRWGSHHNCLLSVLNGKRALQVLLKFIIFF